MDEELTVDERDGDRTNVRRVELKCIYCGDPRQSGRTCNACHNDHKRREKYDPIRYYYKIFTGV